MVEITTDVAELKKNLLKLLKEDDTFWYSVDSMIEFSEHATERMRRRKVTRDEVLEAVTNPDDVLLDTATGYFVAICKKRDRYLVVVYSPTAAVTRIVSVIVTSKYNIVENRMKRGRWVPS